jgi:benzoyl-CoA reductase/2-hydroxyglutaryl-CoA dehydratase subunit BcrC/BadD/HgdB
MARAYTELFIVRAEPFKERYLEAMARDYAIDAFIYHDAKTCPNNSNNRYGLPERLVRKLGLPRVVLNGDLNDLRLYSEEQARTQLEALIEQLGAAPRGAGAGGPGGFTPPGGTAVEAVPEQAPRSGRDQER